MCLSHTLQAEASIPEAGTMPSCPSPAQHTVGLPLGGYFGAWSQILLLPEN